MPSSISQPRFQSGSPPYNARALGAWNEAPDANSNRLNNGATYDVQDRLLNDNLYTYTYDGRGALRQKVNKLTGQISNYTYDVFGNLMSATIGNGKELILSLMGSEDE